MFATSFEITGRKQIIPIEFADIKNFELRESGTLDANEILSNPQITLFSLDFESARAVFVETPPNVNLSQAPFYYQAQRDNARRVLTVSFETMFQLAQRVSLDDTKLILIYSMGRSGSTLASQLFAQVSGVINISEPDVLTQLAAARSMQPDQQDSLKALLDACIRLLCKTPARTAWVIKGRSWAIDLGDWLHEFYSRSKNVYLYRDAVSWNKSSLDAFMDETRTAPDQIFQYENETRGWMQMFVPSIARYDPEQHLSATGLLSLMWLANMESYVELNRAGVEMLAIPYANWKQDARRTALSMLEYCGCVPADLTAIEATLKKDSQAGTSVAQDTAKKKALGNQFFDLTELDRHLQNHPYIKSSDFEVANTLKL